MKRISIVYDSRALMGISRRDECHRREKFSDLASFQAESAAEAPITFEPVLLRTVTESRQSELDPVCWTERGGPGGVHAQTLGHPEHHAWRSQAVANRRRADMKVRGRREWAIGFRPAPLNQNFNWCSADPIYFSVHSSTQKHDDWIVTSARFQTSLKRAFTLAASSFLPSASNVLASPCKDQPLSGQRRKSSR